MFALCLCRGFRMFGKILEDGEGGHRENLLFAHEPHGLSAQLVGMVDGCHSRLRSVERSRLTRAMYRNPLAQTRRLLDRGPELGFCVLINSRQSARLNRAWTGLINLDEILALLQLL